MERDQTGSSLVGQASGKKEQIKYKGVGQKFCETLRTSIYRGSPQSQAVDVKLGVCSPISSSSSRMWPPTLREKCCDRSLGLLDVPVSTSNLFSASQNFASVARCGSYIGLNRSNPMDEREMSCRLETRGFGF